MGRTKVEIGQKQLAEAIRTAESQQTFSNRSKLANAVANALGVSPSVVILRIKEFAITPITPVGKRGRQKGAKLSGAHKQAMQEGRRGKKVGNIAILRKNFPLSRQNLLDRVEKGSLSAAVKANCLECTQFQVVEIKNCTCLNCPMHSFRPYQ